MTFRVGVTDDGSTRTWCAERDHPLMTWSPWVNLTLCRCGQNQQQGKQELNWDAKRELFADVRPRGKYDRTETAK